MAATADAVLAEMRERVSAAHRTRQGLRLRGSGTKDFYGESLTGEVLELRAHQGIVDYEPSELVITARCGTPLSEIEAALAAHGQFLAFEPPAFGADLSIGGVIAAGLAGPRRVYAGAARDFVLGTRLLTADGELLRIGGHAVDAASAHAWWEALRHCQLPLFNSRVIWRLSIPAAAPPLGLPGEPLIDWGGALRWYADPAGDADLRALASAAGGTALCWRGAAPAGRFHPLPPVL